MAKDRPHPPVIPYYWNKETEEAKVRIGDDAYLFHNVSQDLYDDVDYLSRKRAFPRALQLLEKRCGKGVRIPETFPS
jgi:hypothetical protein